MKTKVKAFTIMEMVVVMLLSAIVISISFKSFDILSKSYVDFKNNQIAIAKYATLDRLIALDFLRCKELRKTDNGFRATFLAKEVFYTFDKTLLIRQQEGVADTFSIEEEGIVCKFKNTIVPLTGKLVDELYFNSNFKNEAQIYHYQKVYGADILMVEETKDF